MNNLIHIAKQMGMIDRSYYSNMLNATKCKTITDVYESHMEKNRTVNVEMNDILGMLLLLGLGVGGALITFVAEVIFVVRGSLNQNTTKHYFLFVSESHGRELLD